VEARARARELAALRWPSEADKAAGPAAQPFVDRGATRRSDGLLAPAADLFDAASALAAAGVGPVSVTRPDYVFEPVVPAVDALKERLGL
jgi:ATP phosphoribosyltransferase